MIQPSDTFAARTRRLASEVQRVRDWSGGDPERLGRLADALVELTGHRLDGHEWAEAAPSAQEAVVVAAKTLARHGPVGPYTPLPDAVRSITALVHLATIQSAAGLHEGAGQTLEAALGLRSQLGHLDLDAALAPATVARALLVWARAGLAAGDPAAGNARAAAAASVPLEDGLLAVDVDVLVADARWAAGWPEPAVEHLLRAVERYDGLALDALREPSRSAPGVAERLGEPLFGLYSAAADRVMAIGAPGLGLTLRRRLIDVLGTLAVRSAPAQQLLLTALADLAGDLRSGGRDEDARDAAELAASIAGDDPLPAARARVPMGPRASWTALPAEEAFGVHTGAVPEPSGRLAAQRGPADRLEQQRRAEAAADREARAADAAARPSAGPPKPNATGPSRSGWRPNGPRPNARRPSGRGPGPRPNDRRSSAGAPNGSPSTNGSRRPNGPNGRPRCGPGARRDRRRAGRTRGTGTPRGRTRRRDRAGRVARAHRDAGPAAGADLAVGAAGRVAGATGRVSGPVGRDAGPARLALGAACRACREPGPGRGVGSGRLGRRSAAGAAGREPGSDRGHGFDGLSQRNPGRAAGGTGRVGGAGRAPGGRRGIAPDGPIQWNPGAAVVRRSARSRPACRGQGGPRPGHRGRRPARRPVGDRGTRRAAAGPLRGGARPVPGRTAGGTRRPGGRALAGGRLVGLARAGQAGEGTAQTPRAVNPQPDAPQIVGTRQTR
ncbi:MAG: hypothetical protein R2719_13245 [Micropruina sp.]